MWPYFWGEMGSIGNSMLYPEKAIADLIEASKQVANDFGDPVAGWVYGLGQLTGMTKLAQGLVGTDILTGQKLNGVERWGETLGGVGQGMLTGVGMYKAINPSGTTTNGPTPEVKEGIYEYKAASGKTYVGQSGNIPARIKQHIATGKLPLKNLKTVRSTYLPGGRIAREIAEHARIKGLGGVRKLENIKNPIGPGRGHLLK